MKLKIIHILMFAAFTTLYMACVKKKTYAESPQIDFKAFYPFTGDTAALEITFNDGDGDIGKQQEDQTKNLFMTYYFFDTVIGKFRAWYKPEINDTVRLDYTIRKPKDEYTGKPISGEISVLINEYRPSKKHKRIKYVLYLVDNANHKSNILTTPELAAP